MISTAFEAICPDGRDYLLPGEILGILRGCHNLEPPPEPRDDDLLEMVVRLADTKGVDAEADAAESTDFRMDLEDMMELVVLYSMPYKLKTANSAKHRFHLRLVELEGPAQGDEGSVLVGSEEAKAEMDRMNEIGAEHWASSFPGLYSLVLVWGSDAKFASMANPWSDKSYMLQAHNLWFLFYICYCVIVAMEEDITVVNGAFLLISVLFQAIFVTMMALAEARPWQKLHFFSLSGKNSLPNLTNLGLLVSLVLEFVSRCSSQTCIGDYKATDRSGASLFFQASGKFFQLCNFATETTSIFILVRAIIRTLPTLGPHFGLFIAVYYGFAGMGISMYCGLCRQSETLGGPGYWGSGGYEWTVPANYTMQNSRAFGLPWNVTPYGNNNYYHNMNFDGYLQAMMSLYIIMIGNNWHIIADGPVEVTNGNHRWYFVIFMIVVGFVMLNLLAGAIIDTLDGVRQLMLQEASGEPDALQALCEARINTTFGPSGQLYGETWELGQVDLYGEVRYDAKVCNLVKAEEEGDQDEEAVTHPKTLALRARKAALEARLQEMKAVQEATPKPIPR